MLLEKLLYQRYLMGVDTHVMGGMMGAMMAWTNSQHAKSTATQQWSQYAISTMLTSPRLQIRADMAFAICLVSVQVVVPGVDVWQRAAMVSTGATVVATSAAVLGSAATAGAAGSLIRSVGRTQFLAMSVSLAVPWLPTEYLDLCKGLE